MNSGPRLSTLAIVGGLTVFGFLALAAVLLVTPGPEATQRLGLFFGVVGTVIAALITMARADQSRTQTNGSLDDRIHTATTAAVADALAARRSDDPPAARDGGG